MPQPGFIPVALLTASALLAGTSALLAGTIAAIAGGGGPLAPRFTFRRNRC